MAGEREDVVDAQGRTIEHPMGVSELLHSANQDAPGSARFTDGDVQSLVTASAVLAARAVEVPASPLALHRVAMGEGVWMGWTGEVELELGEAVGLSADVAGGCVEQQLG